MISECHPQQFGYFPFYVYNLLFYCQFYFLGHIFDFYKFKEIELGLEWKQQKLIAWTLDMANI
jgi:hypothetical protein